MLAHLDTVLAFSLVMLLLSLLVTTLVQSVVALFNLRGFHLARGIARLLIHLWPEFDHATARQVARALLKHPAVAHTFGRATTAVSKEELIELMKDAATNPAVAMPEEARQKLQRYLNCRPFFSDLARWFDVAMLRTTERFVATTRAITVIIALAGASLLHIDALAIWEQLSTREEVRLAVLENLDTWREEAAQLAAQPGQAGEAEQALSEALARYQQLRDQVQQLRLQIVPSPLPGFNYFDWLRMDRSTQAEAIAKAKHHLVGVLMTVVFLSLGAPFWYNVLQQIATLRPIVAQKRDPRARAG